MMKIELMALLAAAFASQVLHPKADSMQDHPIPAYPTSTGDNRAVWQHGVKDGVYTATFRDPNNLWRCVVASTVGESNPEGPSSFTVLCYDTKSSRNKPNGENER